MQISRPSCNHCGALFGSEDDVNAAKSFCSKCFQTRRALAEHTFRSRRVVVVAGGDYVVSKRMGNRYFHEKI